MARATVAAGQLGGRHLTIAFAPRGSFSGLGSAGHRSGPVVIALVRVKQGGNTRHVQLIRDEPLVPLI